MLKIDAKQDRRNLFAYEDISVGEVFVHMDSVEDPTYWFKCADGSSTALSSRYFALHDAEHSFVTGEKIWLICDATLVIA